MPLRVDLLQTGAAVYPMRPAAEAAFLRDAVAVTVVVALVAVLVVVALADTREMAVPAVLVQPAVLVLAVVVAAAVAELVLLLIPAIFTVVRLVVVVELGYWEVVQTEPEVLRAVLLGMEVPEVSEAAADVLEAWGQMVQ
jgi:hypothetical protein